MYLYMWINELQNSIKQHIFTVYRIYMILHVQQNRKLENIAITQTLAQ